MKPRSFALRAFAYLVAATGGMALGVASALVMSGLWSTKEPMEFGDIRIEGWVSDFAVATQQASPYVRARVARHGLLALAKTEAVYFVRGADDEGRRLTENCAYRLSGKAMPAQWWSVTLYTIADSKLPMNADQALSVDATSLEGQADNDNENGHWEAVIASERPANAANWISSRGAQGFDLLLRLYVPDEALLTQPETTLPPPSIERIGCKGDPA